MPCTTVTRLGMHGPEGRGSGAAGGAPSRVGSGLRAGQNRPPALPDPAGSPRAPPGPAAPLCSASHTHGLSTGRTLCHHSPPVLPSPRHQTSSSLGPHLAATATEDKPLPALGDTGRGQQEHGQLHFKLHLYKHRLQKLNTDYLTVQLDRDTSAHTQTHSQPGTRGAHTYRHTHMYTPRYTQGTPYISRQN